jgi:hypothetical protein
MDYKQFIIDIYSRLFQEFEIVLQGLSVEDLDYQPQPQLNSIGWLAWHTIRGQDRMNSDLFGEEQLWVRDAWHAKYNRKPDPKDTGFGHTVEQVAAFRSPDVQIYLDYYQAVTSRTKQYVSGRLSPSDLGREVTSPTLGTTNTVENRLMGAINNLQHIGQAGYIRGMLKGIGWYGK